jgi:hypothetical protein
MMQCFLPSRHFLRFLRFLAIAAALSLGMATAASADAANSAAASWHIVYQARTASVTSLYGITAPSRKDGWAVGFTTSKSGHYSPNYVHWNGKGWRAVTISGADGFRPWVAESTSTGDVWFFGRRGTNFEALHLVHGRWRLLAAPGAISSTEIAVLGTDDVWMIGLAGSCDDSTGECTTQLLHWTGTAWVSYTVDALIQALAGWGTHVWAAGVSGPDVATTSAGKTVLYQFGAGSWRAFSSPHPATGVPPMLAAQPDGRLWLLTAPQHGTEWTLRHWTGKRWTQLAIPRRLQDALGTDQLTYDGSAGVWVGTYLHWTGSRWVDAYPTFNPFPSLSGFSMQAIAPVPGSGSVWAAGADNEGRMIAVYGSQP